MKEDSKSLAQAGMLTEIKDVDNLKILIEEVRFDQDKAQVLCMSFYVNLSIGCRTYQGGCNISGLTLPKVLIAITCEKNQRETLGSRKPTWTGLTGPADRSDWSGSNG